MKKVAVCLFVLTLVVSGCSFPGAERNGSNRTGPALENSESNFQYVDPLTLEDIITAFSGKGLILAENKTIERNKYLITKIPPTVYSINNSNQILLIYIFDNISDRKQAVWEGPLGSSTEFDSLPEGVLSRHFVTRNVLIIDLLDLSNLENIPTNEEQILKTVGDIVRSLNNSQEAVFAAKGQNWDAQYAVEYYQHWYTDDAGVTQIDQSAVGMWSAKYIGPNPESIRDIKYTFQTPGWGGSGDGIFEKDGDYYYLRLGAGGDDTIPIKDGVYTISITWAGQEETIDLKPIEQ